MLLVTISREKVLLAVHTKRNLFLIIGKREGVIISRTLLAQLELAEHWQEIQGIEEGVSCVVSINTGRRRDEFALTILEKGAMPEECHREECMNGCKEMSCGASCWREERCRIP